MTIGTTSNPGMPIQPLGTEASPLPLQRPLPRTLQAHALPALKAAAALWLLAAVIGQLIFVVYIASFYGGSALRGDFAVWNKVLPHGYVPGDAMGNAAIAGHMLFAAIIMLGGPLQLVPQVRAHAPAFHRWNGRIYLLTAVAASLTGLYMVWFRGGEGNALHHVGSSLNGVLIIACGAMAVRHALARRLAAHRRWALRLFIVVGGVWFYRVGLMFWIFVNGGPAGFDPVTFRGPFLTMLSFAQYLVPLAVLELYLHARDRAGAAGRIAVACTLLLLTAAMGLGIFVATMGMWLPRI